MIGLNQKQNKLFVFIQDQFKRRKTMNKEIETIKAEINTLSKGIETYHDMVSDKLNSLTKRLDDLIEKEKSVSEIKQEDWIPKLTIGQKFYSISPSGEIHKHKCRKDLITSYGNYEELLTSCNVFKVKWVAESRKHLSPLQRKWAFILDYLGRDESKIMVNNNYKYYPIYYPMYRINNREVMVTSDNNVIHGHPSQYAVSIDMCKQAIEIMGDDIYHYIGVEKP